MTLGENYLKISTALAMLNHMRFETPTGEFVSGIDALETYNDDAGVHMRFKPGYKMLMGDEISDDDLFDMQNRIHDITNRLNGIFNEEDRA